MPRFSISLDGRDIPQMIRWAQMAEAAGFEAVWTSELHHTPFVPLAVIAGQTRRIGLGTAIALAFVRSPWVTALSALDLDAVSGGRFVLGLGTGIRRLNERWHGVAYGRPAPHIKECIEVIRLIMERANSGGPIRYAGQYYDLEIQGWQRPQPPLRPHIPIYLAAVREGMVRTAGEVADGLLGHPVCSLWWVETAVLPNLAWGLRKAGRDRRHFDFCLSLCCAISRDAGQARRAAAGEVAFYATARAFEPLFAVHGFEAEAERVRAAFLRGDVQAMLAAVSDEMVGAFAVAGTPDQVRRQVARYAELADSIALCGPTHFVADDEAEAYQQAIFELFAP
ncbi:MAG: LLM class flavin-dependent oxidoreductase [Dehalococcoidia bacterium]